MHRGFKILIFALMAAFLTVGSVYADQEKAAVLKTSVKALKAKSKQANAVDTATCFDGCHETVKMLHDRGSHKDVNCVNCHEIPANHAEEPGPDTRPATRLDWQACGECHKEQMDSFLQYPVCPQQILLLANLWGR